MADKKRKTGTKAPGASSGPGSGGGSGTGSGTGSKKLWGGRFSETTDPAVERFSASIDFDKALAGYDLRLSTAHAAMLCHTGLISSEDEQSIRSAPSSMPELFPLIQASKTST
jgi:hypothetical protein